MYLFYHVLYDNMFDDNVFWIKIHDNKTRTTTQPQLSRTKPCGTSSETSRGVDALGCEPHSIA